MSSKLPADKKAVALKTRRDSTAVTSKRPIQPIAKQRSSIVSPVDVLLDDNCSTTIQVTVKTQGRKRTSTMVSGSPTSQKAIEEKKKANSGGECHQTWSSLFREQNRLALKQELWQTMQQAASRTQAKSSQHGSSESKEAKKNLEVRRSQRYELGATSKRPDKIPIKREPANRRSSDHVKPGPMLLMPSSTSVASSLESKIVVDRGIQCGGLFDYSNDRFGVFNPVRTLGFLMKELEERVKDERSSKILTEMEQALLRVPIESGEPTSVDLDSIALRAKLEASVAQLDATCTKLNTTCATLREQRDSLQRQVQKQSTLLEEAKVRESNFAMELKRLQSKLDETTNSLIEAQKTIVEHRDDNKRIEQLQKMSTELRNELNRQVELAQQRFMEGQYLKLEKEKLLVLSSYKDSQLVEHRTAVKELQNFISEQLMGLREVNKQPDVTVNHQISVLHGGLACSSPTRTSSEHSNFAPSWHGISDISLSTVGPNIFDSSSKEIVPNRSKNSTSDQRTRESQQKPPTKEVRTQLEFVSLPGGETSHTMSLTTIKAEESKRHSNMGMGDLGEASPAKRDDLSEIAAAIADIEKPVSTDDTETTTENKGEDGTQNSSRVKKTSEKTKKRRSSTDYSRSKSLIRDVPKMNAQTKESSSENPINVLIKEQFQNFFDNMRQQSLLPVNIPSPARLYPHADFSDSSLPSISGISDSNIV